MHHPNSQISILCGVSVLMNFPNCRQFAQINQFSGLSTFPHHGKYNQHFGMGHHKRSNTDE